jgi:hypothetical protein
MEGAKRICAFFSPSIARTLAAGTNYEQSKKETREN